MTIEIKEEAIMPRISVGIQHPNGDLMTRMSSENDSTMENGKSMEEEIRSLRHSLDEIQITQKQHSQGIQKVSSISSRMEGLEKRQDEVVRLLTGLRSELAGISSGMARRDSLILGSGSVSGLTSLRRDSLIMDLAGRRDSLVLGSDGRPSSIPVMEVEPWEPPHEVQEVLERLLERQFLLSPWVREKRLRNQLRLILKDHLEAGPVRRSTVTKIVHDAHQVFPVWRSQCRETMFNHWDTIQDLPLEEAVDIIFGQFKKPRFPDEQESSLLYAEHMIEVGQYLTRKAEERAEKQGKVILSTASVTSNSKFWYEVRKKISEVLEANRSKRNSLIPQDDDSDDAGSGHVMVTPQSSLDHEDGETEYKKRTLHAVEIEVKV